MKAWIIDRISDLTKEDQPLKRAELPVPEPQDGELLIRVSTCGVCHTEIDEIEGRTPPPRFPVVPGHQVIGYVEKSKSVGTGRDLSGGDLSGHDRIRRSDRVGVAWIYSACGKCNYCLSGNENLCENFRATGRDVNGGYAEYMVVPEKFAYPIPEIFTDVEAAPLLCAGAIGFRSLALAGMSADKTIGLTGFGASAHLVLKLILYRYPQSEVYVFARSAEERQFALDLGARWAGDSGDKPPVLLDCIIDTTPVWTTVLRALECLRPGGRLVINAIRKESADKNVLLDLDYSRHLWMEKEIKSVANVTSHDVRSFLRVAAEMRMKPETESYSFDDANRAILDIKHRNIKGAKVLVM